MNKLEFRIFPPSPIFNDQRLKFCGYFLVSFQSENLENTFVCVSFFSLFIKLLYYFLYIVLVFIFRANFYQLENNFQTNWYYRYLYEVRVAPVLPAVNIKNKIGKINQIVQTITNLLLVMSYCHIIQIYFKIRKQLENCIELKCRDDTLMSGLAVFTVK